MVRNFLGNIKGPRGSQGPQGPKGDDGGFNDESIGVNNLINIAELIPRGASASYDYDLKSGMINYTDLEWYLSQKLVLNGVKHTFRVEDYLSNPAVRNGELIFMLKDSGGEQIVYQSVFKKTPLDVDLTGRGVQEYTLELRATNTTPFSGFIEKPMLVEGDYSVLWQHKDIVVDNAHRFILYGYTIEKEESVIRFVANSKDTINFDNGFVLGTGIYQINLNLRTRNTDGIIERNRYRVRFYIDGVLQFSRISNFGQQNLDISFSMPVESGVLTVTTDLFTTDTDDESIELFTGSTDSKFSVIKLGGF